MKQNNDEISISKLWSIFKSNIVVILVTALIFAACGFCYSKFMVKPVYSTSLLLCASNTKEADPNLGYYNQTDIIASYKLVNSFMDIITSNNVLNQVAQASGLDYSASSIKSMISMSSSEENLIFRLKVTGNNPDDICKIANTIAEIAPNTINDYLHPTSIKVVDYAMKPTHPTPVNVRLNTMLAGFCGLVLAYAFFFLRMQFDVYVRSEEDIKSLFGDVPVLGCIPMLEEDSKQKTKFDLKHFKLFPKKKKSVKLPPSAELLNSKSSFFVVEAYKDLRTNILFSLPEGKCRVIAFASSVMSEGKSTTCVNTAITFAEMGKKVLIIDTDMRRPRIHRIMKSTSSPGLSNLLLNLATYEECVFATNYQNLDVIFAGDISPNPAELLSSDKMKELLDEMSKHYDYIFVDTPAVAPVTDSAIICKLVSGVVFITRQGETEKRALESSVDKMRFSGAKILGYVINGVDTSHTKNSKYKYNYKYKSEYK